MTPSDIIRNMIIDLQREVKNLTVKNNQLISQNAFLENKVSELNRYILQLEGKQSQIIFEGDPKS